MGKLQPLTEGKKIQDIKLSKPVASSSKWIKIAIAVILLSAVGFSLYLYRDSSELPQAKSKSKLKSKETFSAESSHHNVNDKGNSKSFKDQDEGFKTNFVKQLTITAEGLPVKVKELAHNVKDSSVRAYVIDGLLSSYECDQLIMAHEKHSKHSNLDPILCFSDIHTLRKHLSHAKINIRVSNQDFTSGTRCLNESFSQFLKPHFTWSYSTAFYPGESKFSVHYAERIHKVTGLAPENGGKFQITSYPHGVAYKNHTDCVMDSVEKRDRFATILVYLQDVKSGGETCFPELGIKVKPRKGRALVWNSMDSEGHCDGSSIHNSSHVESGHKYIIQRWYYYQNFPSLGKRVHEPELPKRKPHQPRVTCDEYEFGSCRWYDEWTYDHLVNYPYS